MIQMSQFQDNLDSSEFHSRTRALLGDDAFARLAAMRVAIFGLGGVGGWCAEALARSLSPARLMAVMQAIERLQTARRRNMNPSLFSVYMCAQLRAAAGK